MEKILTDYEFVLWDKNRFDVESVLWVKEAYYQKKYAFAADYIRLYAVYNYGGIYLDTDVEILKKFDDLLQCHQMFGYEGEERQGIEAGCFGAEKNDNFIGYCLEHYRNRHFLKKDGSMDTETLPMIMQSAMLQNPGLFVYPWCYFTAKNQETGKVVKNSFTYAIHHFAGSWLSEYEKEVKQLSISANDKYGKRFVSKFYVVLRMCFLRFKYFGFLHALTYYLTQYVLFQNGLKPLKKMISFFK